MTLQQQHYSQQPQQYAQPPQQPYAPQQVNVVYAPAPPIPQQPFSLRCRSCLLTVTGLKLVLSILILILSIATMLMAMKGLLRGAGRGAGLDGTGIWGGLFLIACATVGLIGILKTNKCLLITYLVLAILAACMFGLAVFIASTVWASMTSIQETVLGTLEEFHANTDDLKDILNRNDAAMKHVTGMQAAIAIFAMTYIICAIIASGMLCANLCTCCGADSQSGGQYQAVQLATTTTATSGGAAAPTYTHTYTGQQADGQMPASMGPAPGSGGNPMGMQQGPTGYPGYPPHTGGAGPMGTAPPEPHDYPPGYEQSMSMPVEKPMPPPV